MLRPRASPHRLSSSTVKPTGSRSSAGNSFSTAVAFLLDIRFNSPNNCITLSSNPDGKELQILYHFLVILSILNRS